MFTQAAARQEENKDQKKIVKFHNALFRNLMISGNGLGASLESFKKIVCGHAKENGWEQCIKFRHINFSMLELFQERIRNRNYGQDYYSEEEEYFYEPRFWRFSFALMNRVEKVKHVKNMVKTIRCIKRATSMTFDFQ